MATTQAKIGRSMKKLGMIVAPLPAVRRGVRGAGCGGRAGVVRMPWTGFGQVAVPDFLHPGHHHLIAGRETGGDHPGVALHVGRCDGLRSEEHTSELQSIRRKSYADFRWKK